jgi:hypothetical protein
MLYAAKWKLVQRLNTPAKCNAFSVRLPYNWRSGGTCDRFGEVVNGRAHCLEAAVGAAVILEQHGYPPLLDLESQDLWTMCYVFKRNGLWARSRALAMFGLTDANRFIGPSETWR